MKSLEENTLLAVLDAEDDRALVLLAQMSPAERVRLAKAAKHLAYLCTANDICSVRESLSDECPNCYRVGHSPHIHDGKEFCAGCDPEGAAPNGDGVKLSYRVT
jgi:hypothetical protein